MIQIRRAKIHESRDILDFYRNIINTPNDDFNPKWNENYPDLEYIENSILKEELYIYKPDEKIVSSIIVNNNFGGRYNDANWIVNAEASETVVIHAFAVDPGCRGKKISKEIFNIIRKYSLKNNKKAIRVDIIYGNDGAESVFKHLGFNYIDTVEEYYDAVGFERFLLYEYDLK